MAVVTGYLAKKEIAGSGGAKTGGGLAQAGFILGIVGVVLGLVLLILQVSGAVNYNCGHQLRRADRGGADRRQGASQPPCGRLRTIMNTTISPVRTR